MGSLTLPEGGLIDRNAVALIYSVERVEPYRTLLGLRWQAAQEGLVTVSSHGLTVIEALVNPIRDGNEEIGGQYREALAASVFRVLDTPLVAFEEAARLRANTQLKTPDALHAAVALHAGCDLFVTNDAASRGVPESPTAVLDDLIAEDVRT